MYKLIETFCDVDDFCQSFIEQWQQQLIESCEIKRRRSCKLSPAEIMTIIIHFHQSHYRDFKNYYLLHVCHNLKDYFPYYTLSSLNLLVTHFGACDVKSYEALFTALRVNHLYHQMNLRA